MEEIKDFENTEDLRKLPATSLLQAYMNDINRFPLLDKPTINKLTIEYAASKDPVLRTKLINHNLRLVVKIGFEYRAAYHNLLDLIQEGNIGLIKGVEKFDPAKEVPLASYLAMWIRAYMLRFIMNSHRLVKVGTTESQRKLFFNLSKEKAKLEALGIEATDAVMAEHLEVEEKELTEMQQRMGASEGSISSDDDDKSDMPLVSEIIAPDIALEKEELKVNLRDLLAKFREGLVKKGADKKVIVFDLRFMSDDPETLEAVGAKECMDVTRERVRQIESELKESLQIYLRRAV